MKKFFIISIVCFMSGMAMAQMADFTWYYTNGTPCVPGTVTFTNTSTNPSGIQSVDWDFGDNTTHATTMDAVHPYTTAGTFTVTLTVTYSNTTKTKTATIRMVNPVTATFTTAGDTICPGEEVSFTSSVTAPGNAGQIRSYLWSFGDGGQSSQPNPKYVYENNGNLAVSYPVTLTITDTNGCSTSYTMQDAVPMWQKPEADFYASDSIFCYNNNQTSGTSTFTNTTGVTTGNTYQWFFGPMNNPYQTSTSANPTVTFPQGTYNVTLVATSPKGCTDTLTKYNYIQMINFEALYNVSDTILCGVPSKTVVQGLNVRGTQYKWTWGDGYENFSANSYLEKTYRVSGTFDVVVQATAPQGCIAYDTFTIHVYDDVAGIPYVIDTNMCDPATPVLFYDSTAYNSNDNFGFKSTWWSFGDGMTGVGDTIAHTYPALGDYECQMIVTTPYGCVLDTVFFRVHFFAMSARAAVIDPAPPNPPHGCAPHSVTLANIVDSLVTSSPITDFIWRWDYFGDTTDTTNSLDVDVQSHTYQDTGVYQVYVTLINEQGCKYDVYINTIMVGYPPVCSFEFDFKEDCKASIGLNVRAYDVLDSNGNIVGDAYANDWTWIDPSTGSPIGSGDTTSVGFSSPGYHALQLSPSHNGCGGSGPTLDSTCYVCPPVVAFDNPKNDMDGTPPEYCDFINVQFSKTHDNCLGTAYRWGFGDGKYKQTWTDTLLPTDPDPSFYYCDTGGAEPGYLCNLEGVIIATLWAENTDSLDSTSPTYNRCGYCTDETQQVFLISPYRMNFTTDMGSENVYVCAGDSIRFWDSTEVLNCVSHELWGFSFISAADPNHVAWPLNEMYPTHGYKPVASKRPPIGGTWVKFYYPNSYVAVLQDTSAYGKCIFNDTLIVNVYPQSIPAFVSSRTKSNYYFGRDTLCLNNPDTLYLKDASFSPFPFENLRITGWEWVLGKDTSHLQNPALVDTIYGLKDLKLTVINEYGCDSTIEFPEYVLVNMVDARFTTTKKSYCNKTPVPFTNTSEVFPKSYNKNTTLTCRWDFGDGSPVYTQTITSTSTQAQKVVPHTYDLPNVMNCIAVTVTCEADGMDCSSTFTDSICITRPIAAFTDNGHNYPCPGSTGINASFYDNSQGNIVYYEWNFGDTASGSANHAEGSKMDTVLHLYHSAGTYDVIYIVTDDASCTDTSYNVGYFFIDGPAGDFTYTPLSGCVNLTVAFQPTITNTDSIIINPDGAAQVIRSGIAVNNTVRNTYKVPGAYIPFFTLIKWTNNNGNRERCVVEWLGEDTIWAIEMKPDFDIDSLYCPQVPITFNNTTVVQPGILALDSSTWTFYEGGDTTTMDNGQTQYDSAGFYKVTVTGYSKLCAKSTSKYIEVIEIPDVKFIPDTAKACDGLEVVFTVDSSTITPLQMSRISKYEWTFSDGETMEGHPASREFAQSGNYTYDVDITFVPKNCVKRYTDTVVIFAYISPVADFTPTPTEANAGETFNFIDASTKGDGKLVKWSWDFGDDEVDSTEQNPSHIYENTSGYITVTLVVTDEYGCKSTVQKQVLVTESMSFPNVLTPDATVGGEPCVFRPIEDKGFFKEFKMEIYDKWGVLVWKNSCTDPNCPSPGTDFWWDGRNKQGSRVSDGVYYWVVYGMPLSETNTIILNGSVTVIGGTK